MSPVSLTESRNAVRAAMFSKELTEAQGMNALQDAGVISDLCVRLEDVHHSDHAKAIEYFRMEYEAPVVD